MAEPSVPESQQQSKTERSALLSETPDAYLDSNFFCVIDDMRKSMEAMAVILSSLTANGRRSVNPEADNELHAHWIAHSTAARNVLRDIDLYVRAADEKVRQLLVGS